MRSVLMFSRQGTEALPGRAVPGSPGICMQAQVLFFGRCPIQVGHHLKCSGGYIDRAFQRKKVQADT